MTPSLSLLESFVTTARLGSFAAAGRRLGISASGVGKAVQRLEAELGVTLLQRSTRRLELTEEGRGLLAGLGPALEALDEALLGTRARTARIEGPIVLTLPLVGYHLVNAKLGPFLARHPGVTVELRFSDAIVDLIGEGVDLGLRNGPLQDSALKLRPFCGFRHGLFAAPGYIAAQGVPTLETLGAHDRIAFRFSMTGRLQAWRRADGTPLALPPPRLVMTAIEGARTAALAGMGVAWLPDFILAEDLAQGRLVPVLEEAVCERGQFFLVWPASRALPRRTRALIDHLVAEA